MTITRISVCFSHDVQGGLGGAQPLAQPGVLPGEPGDLGLLGGQFADLLTGPFARQHARVALLAPLADQRRIQPLPPQIRAAVTVLTRLLVGVRWASLSEAVNARRRRGPSGLGWVGSIRSLSFTEEIVELVMMYRSVSRPASGRFAVNQWTQLTLTRRGARISLRNNHIPRKSGQRR